jgi:hypothetical protein
VLDDIFCRSSNEELEVKYVSLLEYGGRICNTNYAFKWHLVFWVTIGSNTNLHLTLIYLFSVVKTNQKFTTCNRLDLWTLGFWPIVLKIHPGHYCFLCSPRSILCLEPQTGPPQQHFVAPTPFFFFLFFYNPQRTNNQAPIQQLTMQTSFFLPSGRGVGTRVRDELLHDTLLCVCVCVFAMCMSSTQQTLCSCH